jgi:hypothetical protein
MHLTVIIPNQDERKSYVAAVIHSWLASVAKLFHTEVMVSSSISPLEEILLACRLHI